MSNKYKNTRKLGYTAFVMLIIITLDAIWNGWLKDHIEVFFWGWSALVGTYIVVPNVRSGAENIWGKHEQDNQLD